jgi:hypothetical protein
VIAVTQLAIRQYIAIVGACCRAGSTPVHTGSQGWSVYFDRTEVAQSLARARHVVPDKAVAAGDVTAITPYLKVLDRL